MQGWNGDGAVRGVSSRDYHLLERQRNRMPALREVERSMETMQGETQGEQHHDQLRVRAASGNAVRGVRNMVLSASRDKG